MFSLRIDFAITSRVLLTAALLIAGFQLAPITMAQSTTLVKTTAGKLSGVKSSDGAVISFKGIPYAMPPVNDLRWRAPKPAALWSGVLKADHFSRSCMQTSPSSMGPWTEEYMDQNERSEDCLYLNVWTEGIAGKRPVLVWIHGGGFDQGSTSVALYNGEALARKGIVVVTINYRLGVFGFFAHPELTKESGTHSSGNYGLQDTLAALEWVYPASTPSKSQIDSAHAENMVSTFLWAKHRAAHSKTPVYTYLWDHPLPGPKRGLYRVFHSTELPYVFNSLASVKRPWEPADYTIAEKTTSYWANFVKTGNPNGDGLANWPPFDGDTPVTMELGDRFEVQPIADAAQVKLLETILMRAVRSTKQ